MPHNDRARSSPPAVLLTSTPSNRQYPYDDYGHSDPHRARTAHSPQQALDASKMSTFEHNPLVVNQCTLSWHHVTYTVKNPRGRQSKSRSLTSERRLLSNVSGRAAPGELTAILGPSGAGKTTLLDILSDRKHDPSCRMEGAMEVNGRPLNPSTYRAMTNYVAQDMSFLGSFTVLETLQMAAGLSLPNHIPRVTREMRIQDVIEDMGLRNCARTRVGDVFYKGISQGQRKRLSIAMELLSNPSILLLDEPTSGLDASSALQVMELTKRLCRDAKATVITTIHQPSSAIYDLFTNISILSMGEMIYFGAPESALSHFFAMGYVCPMYSNPAEYFCQLVNKDFHDNLQLEPFLVAWDHSNEATNLQEAILDDRHRPGITNAEVLKAFAPSAWNQFFVLLKRNCINNWRNPSVLWIRVFMYGLLCAMAGTMFLNHKQEKALVSLLFYTQAFLVFMSVAVLPAFIEQRAVFQRERMNYSLNLGAFTMAQFLAALPGIALIALVSSALVVFLAGIHSFPTFLLNMFLSLVAAESLMYVIGALVSHYIVGIAIGAGIFGMFMLCEGFMVPFQDIPAYWKWGYYLAFHTYSFESFVYNHFSAVTNGTQVLAEYGMENVNVRDDMLVIGCNIVVLQLVFMLVLYFRHRFSH